MMNRFFGALVPLSFLATALAASADCAPDKVDLRGAWGQASFSVELAVTPEERGRGLMFRESMPAQAGMLFFFDPPRSVSFWMRNTLIPLDMIFADRTGVVKRVHANAIPGDETGIPGGNGIYAVLEINGGLAETLGIAPGSELRHPLFGDAAVWACDAQ